MSQWWSWALTAAGITAMWLVGNPRTARTGWIVGAAAQLLWLTYAVATRQWGFIVSALLYGGIYAWNWLRLRRRARADALHAAALRAADRRVVAE